MLNAPDVSSILESTFASLRAREFGRLDQQHLAYLDYTGSALYAESQLRSHQAMLIAGVFGNPHSENQPSRISGTMIDDARDDVLRFFHADPSEYVVCFTANTSTAVKLVAESYPFCPGGVLALSTDNHNSVNGIREYARRAGARVSYLQIDDDLRLIDPARHLAPLRPAQGCALFAYPAQSNFSGLKHPLSLIDDAHAAGFDVLLDAAAFAPSNPLSLRDHHPEFVVLSFYKMFGYPTGVGALIVRRHALERLKRPWFAGGTVDFVSVQNDMYRLRELAAGFEDGTPDFLNIAALPAGLTLLSTVGMEHVQAHVAQLTSRMLAGLLSLGASVRVYGPRDMRDRGGTIAFNLLDRHGHIVPYSLVERRASDAGVAIRGGCFCNPGAAEAAFGLEVTRTQPCLMSAARNGFTIEKFAECVGDDTAVGAVRASVGVANNGEDVDRLISLVASFAD